MLEEVTRLLNLEKHLPSYKNCVTVACLKVIRKLQKCGHLPSTPKLYRSYAAYGQYIDVRVAAMECLVDFVKVDGEFEDLMHLLDLLSHDPDSMAKHKLARLLIDNPPFSKSHRNRKLERAELVDLIWHNMKYAFLLNNESNVLTIVSISSSAASNNAQVRCDFVDLYFSLFGTKEPLCLSKNELPLSSSLPRVPKIPKLTEVKRSASPLDNPPPPRPPPVTLVEEPAEYEDNFNPEPEIIKNPVEIKEEPVETARVFLFICNNVVSSLFTFVFIFNRLMIKEMHQRSIQIIDCLKPSE